MKLRDMIVTGFALCTLGTTLDSCSPQCGVEGYQKREYKRAKKAERRAIRHGYSANEFNDSSNIACSTPTETVEFASAQPVMTLN